MKQVNVTIPLPREIAEEFGKEARRKGRQERRYVSRAAVMREVLMSARAKCQPIQSIQTPATSQ